MGAAGFDAFCRRKVEVARSATLRPMATTAQDTAGADLVPIGTDWTRRLFDGAFYRSSSPGQPALPAVSLVIGCTASGDLVTGEDLVRASSATSQHLLHEGLVRVEADAVIGSVASLRSPEAFRSVWHPEFVEMRRVRRRERHPVQVIVTSSGDLPLDDSLLFAEPSLRVVVVTRNSVASWLGARLRTRPWVQVLDAGEPLSMFVALTRLRAMGLEVVAAVGGRWTTSALLRAGLVSDLYAITPGEAGGATLSRLCGGAARPRRRLLSKAAGDRSGVCFEHLVRPSAFAAARLRGES
jgi:riboflavin biosynthesis pyrimidine reductase